jgi:hypothetical protein
MSNVPTHPLPLRDAVGVAKGLPEAQQSRLLVASIDATLARLAYEDEPSIDTAVDIATADVALTRTIATLKGTQQ